MGRHVADWQILVGRAASAITQRRGTHATAQEGGNESPDGLLFLGNPHETVPRALLLDRRLGAVDILGWQMIRLLANADRTTAFPTYDDLQPLLRNGVDSQASRGTVARVIAVLRLTRWLSLAHRARNETTGRVIGNVYVLHDEPVDTAEARLLDDDYIDFVLQSCRHKNRIVREVAISMRAELEEEGALSDVGTADQTALKAPMARLNRRARRFQEMRSQVNAPSSPRELEQFAAASPQLSTRTQRKNKGLATGSPREPSDTPSRTDLSSPRELSQESSTYRLVRDANSVPTVVRSSKLPTTSTGSENQDSRHELFWSDHLELSADERRSLSDGLSDLPNDLCQAVLDETSGRVAAGKSDNPRGLLHALIRRAKTGEFRATRFAQRQAERRGERYITDTPDSDKSRSPSDTPTTRPVPAHRSVSPPLAVTRQEAEAARAEMLASLGIKR
ncbi:STY4528 family pathogenicity island replication protein [Billgrantia montanilacus]|uniref:Uncharacterized protein n=1 Tax=Billgrantia montanilacus TaxID=2282305 RepID=A0A368TQG8_9GAMM|nr:STY4528 family pathogenicity island replication protein [Halomonas montanilacus]RCV86894.1 hypothetical protein DU505_18865 [Halomonas montanilacus]